MIHLLQKTHTRAEKTLVFEITELRETFHISPPIQTKGDWMMGLASLEVYNSAFNITEENNNSKLYIIPDEKSGGVSCEKVRDKIEKDLNISDIAATGLPNDIIGRILIEEYREKLSKRIKNDAYMLISAIYDGSLLHVLKSFLRLEIDLVEDEIRLLLDEYISSFTTYDLKPGFYIFIDFAEALFNILQHEYEVFNNSVDIEVDDITMKKKLVVKSSLRAETIDEKSFFNTSLGFNPHWVYKYYNEYIRQKIVNLSTTKKIHLKCDVNEGSVVNGFRQPILYSFVLDEPAGYKVFFQPETVLY